MGVGMGMVTDSNREYLTEAFDRSLVGFLVLSGIKSGLAIIEGSEVGIGFNLEIGDIVQYLGTDWVVEGQLTYNEVGFTWLEYMLHDADRISWLSVEEDDLLEVQWLEPTNALEVGSNPPKELTFEGEVFRCVSSGVAVMKRKGNLQRRQSEECHYYDYEGPGDRVLSIEDWDGEIEVTLGENIRPSSLSLLPGTGGSVYRN